MIFPNHRILPFFIFYNLFIGGRFSLNYVTKQGHIAIVGIFPLSLSMYSFWSAIPFSFSYEIPCPCWFPLVGVLLKECLCRLLWLCHVMIFRVFWNCFSNFHVSKSHLFRFLDFLGRSPPGSKVCRFFIKCYISTDVNLLKSWEVYLVGI